MFMNMAANPEYPIQAATSAIPKNAAAPPNIESFTCYFVVYAGGLVTPPGNASFSMQISLRDLGHDSVFATCGD